MLEKNISDISPVIQDNPDNKNDGIVSIVAIKNSRIKFGIPTAKTGKINKIIKKRKKQQTQINSTKNYKTCSKVFDLRLARIKNKDLIFRRT